MPRIGPQPAPVAAQRRLSLAALAPSLLAACAVQPTAWVDQPRDDNVVWGVETCNGLDDDGDGEVDEDAIDEARHTFRDDDGDGYGLGYEGKGRPGCPGTYRSMVPGDCDDDVPSVYPGAPEACDGVDNDCNGIADDPDGPGCNTRWVDDDLDGTGSTTEVCACPATPRTAATTGDCDDQDPNVTAACGIDLWATQGLVAGIEGTGAAVAAAADTDGDGDAEIVTGNWDVFELPTRGTYDAGGLLITTVPLPSAWADPSFDVEPPRADDFDGDGMADVVSFSRTFESYYAEPFSAEAPSMETLGASIVVSPVAGPGAAALDLRGLASGAEGRSLQSHTASDLDGDGVTDIALTMVEDHMGPTIGTAVFYTGDWPTAGYAYHRTDDGEYGFLWAELSALGDVDGDGLDDVAAKDIVVLGPLVDALLDETGITLEGAYDLQGGDLDGDGYGELLAVGDAAIEVAALPASSTSWASVVTGSITWDTRERSVETAHVLDVDGDEQSLEVLVPVDERGFVSVFAWDGLVAGAQSVDDSRAHVYLGDEWSLAAAPFNSPTHTGFGLSLVTTTPTHAVYLFSPW